MAKTILIPRSLARPSSNRNQKLREVAADVLRNLTAGEVRTHFEA